MQTYTADQLVNIKREPLLDYVDHYDFVISGALRVIPPFLSSLRSRG
ncbi:MAG: hypothetical protein RL571_3522 [Pseudomonadota bacterium]|jgi:hypothetical protein